MTESVSRVKMQEAILRTAAAGVDYQCTLQHKYRSYRSRTYGYNYIYTIDKPNAGILDIATPAGGTAQTI